MQLAAAALSLIATVLLTLLVAFSSPQASALPTGSQLTPATTPATTPTVNPTVIPQKPLKCLQKNITSYCIPNTFKYQVCSPAVKTIECPIDSYCKETVDPKGKTIAYCKYIN